MSQKTTKRRKSSDRGTCPICGYRVRTSSINPTSSIRICGKHYVYYYSQGRVCEGSRKICKEDEDLVK